jgi:hypothetical protein
MRVLVATAFAGYTVLGEIRQPVDSLYGVSAGVALKLREERDVSRVRALLRLSNVATQGTDVALSSC